MTLEVQENNVSDMTLPLKPKKEFESNEGNYRVNQHPQNQEHLDVQKHKGNKDGLCRPNYEETYKALNQPQ